MIEPHLCSDTLFRIVNLEFLDEIEEFQMLLEHYCFSWATTSANAKCSNISFTRYDSGEYVGAKKLDDYVAM